MPTRACWPPESWCGRFKRCSAGSPTSAATSATRDVVLDARAEAGGDVARRGEGRIERVVGALEDELDGAPRRIAPEARRGNRADVGAVEPDRAVALVGEAGDDPRQRRLARPALADHAHRLAGSEGEADAVEGVEIAALADGKAHLQADRLERSGHSGLQQATPWRETSKTKGGGSAMQRSVARSQRPAKRQAGGLGVEIGQRARDADEVGDGPRVVGGRADQRRRIGMAGRGEQGFGRRLLGDLPGMHDDDAVGIGAGEAEIVGDEQRRHPPLRGVAEDEVEDRGLGGGVEAGGRLVGDEQRRIAGKRDGDHHALAHAAGQFAGIGVPPKRGLGNADRRERAVDRLVEARAGQAAMLVDHVGDLAADGADRVERGAGVLEDDADLAAAERAPGALRHRPEVDAAESRTARR